MLSFFMFKKRATMISEIKNFLLFLTSLILLMFVTTANAALDGVSGTDGLVLLLLLLGLPVLICLIFVKVFAMFVRPERKQIVIVTVGSTLLLALFARILFTSFIGSYSEHSISFLDWMIGSFILAGAVGVFVAIRR